MFAPLNIFLVHIHAYPFPCSVGYGAGSLPFSNTITTILSLPFKYNIKYSTTEKLINRPEVLE